MKQGKLDEAEDDFRKVVSCQDGFILLYFLFFFISQVKEVENPIRKAVSIVTIHKYEYTNQLDGFVFKS